MTRTIASASLSFRRCALAAAGCLALLLGGLGGASATVLQANEALEASSTCAETGRAVLFGSSHLADYVSAHQDLAATVLLNPTMLRQVSLNDAFAAGAGCRCDDDETAAH